MKKILILSSNPRRDLNLDREISDLSNAVQRLEKFEIRLGLGVRSQELAELLAEHSPEIVHFCGHGAGEKGLVFQDEKGQEELVSTKILTRIFKTFSQEINCTVLNACDSDRQAEAIVEHINYVVGMSQPILDKAAHLFSVGFYKGLAAGKSIEQAYEMGCIAIQIWSETQSQSTKTRQYRKLEYVGEAVQPEEPQLAEYLKPLLLKKSERFPFSSAGIKSVSGVPHTSVSSEHPQEFVAYVQQEIDRKEYKDNARDAYDNFGQFSAQNAVSLEKKEYEQRKILLGKVRQFWIEGFLQPSLQGIGVIKLDLKGRPDAIADLSQGIEALSVELDASYERLRETQIYEEMGQGRTLLILGSPGAGKTIALLQLAQRLIERSELNLSLPIPVVFNLSSWAKDRKLIVDWLIDELREKYQVPKLLSEPWIRQQQLILLLDGLDEVKEEYRNDCIHALNKFIGLFPQTEVAVCSRVRDYEVLTERLQISSALCLQPLTSEQVHQFLDSVGGSLAGLKTLLLRDAELEQFAQTPLILNFMSVAYQGWSVEELTPQLRSTRDRDKNLFNDYIDRRLERGSASEYSKDKVLCWLRWLASWMVQEKQTIFLIEKMQPTWLTHRSERCIYRIIILTVTGAIAGLAMIFGSVGLGWLIFGTLGFVGLGWLMGWITVPTGLIFGAIVGLISGLSKEILPLEKISWSWQRAKSRFVRDFFLGLISVLIFVAIGGFTGICLRMVSEATFDMYGSGRGPRFSPNGDRAILINLSKYFNIGLMTTLIAGLIVGLRGGLSSYEIELRTLPNQGIRSSLCNCFIIGLTVGLIAGLTAGLPYDGLRLDDIGMSSTDITELARFTGLIAGLIAGLIVGLINGLKYGGGAVIQHFALRLVLYKKGHIPWNYAKFLNFASDRLLMKKVGGGYVFFHRMLLGHFARMKQD